MRARTILCACLTPLALGAGPALATPTFDAAADFSATSNPNGAWSFGYENTTLGFGFTPATLSGNYLGVDYWQRGPDLPGAFHNPAATPNYAYGTAVIDPGMLILHPGPVGEYEVARFTAPTTGTYQFSVDFIGQDQIIGTTTDVHLLVNDGTALLVSGMVTGFHSTFSSGSYSMLLQAGDTIDAAVGMGNNGTYYGDSTGLDFRVELVPAPGAAALLGLGGLLATRRRRCG